MLLQLQRIQGEVSENPEEGGEFNILVVLVQILGHLQHGGQILERVFVDHVQRVVNEQAAEAESDHDDLGLDVVAVGRANALRVQDQHPCLAIRLAFLVQQRNP